MKKLFLLVTLVGLWVVVPATPAASVWEHSIVRIEAARKAYDYYQPWNQRSDNTEKIGLVVSRTEILTTAQDLSDTTLVRVQKGGRGPWALARIVWVDYYANLAVLTTDDVEFWKGLRPARLAAKPPGETAAFQVLRWREGKLETKQAEFSQHAARSTQMSDLSHVHLELSSEIQGAGYSEPIVVKSQVVGLMASQQGRTCNVIPASFLRMILEGRRAGNTNGLGYFHFYWQPSENSASLAHLKLPGQPRGVIVIDVPARLDGQPSALEKHDIILQIDGFDIDMQGDYEDPDYGPLLLENLACRGKWAGDPVKIKIWRAGQAQEVVYQMPKYEYSLSLVPDGVFDQAPDYLIVGGLVFQPLTTPYLQRWGQDWQRTAPFRLNHYRADEATSAKPALVILSQVLPDRYNIGYQEQRALVVAQVNGQKVHSLAEIQAALQKPDGNFHIIDLAPNDSLNRIVLAAGEPERSATARILERFGITKAAQIASPSK
jgi:hypothetical protein